MIVKYMVRSYDSYIEHVECEKATEKSVWHGGARRSRRGEYRRYFDTWEEAHEHLVTQARHAHIRAVVNANAAKEKLDDVLALKNPEAA